MSMENQQAWLAALRKRADHAARAIVKFVGGLIFIIIVVVAALGVANVLSETIYHKSLLAVIKDLLFIFRRI